MKILIKLLVLSGLLFCLGCSEEFLDKKPDKALVVPTTLDDLQALLDAVPDGMNTAPGIQVIAADDFYYSAANLDALSEIERNSYLWEENIYQGLSVSDWNEPWRCIFYSNIVLEALAKIGPDAGSLQQWNTLKSSALFFRAMALYNLSQVFAAPYEKSSAGSLPGIPVRLTSDVNEIVGRGTLQQTYDQIINDLIEAEPALPGPVSYTNRPSQTAVRALLARIYLSMEEYEKAAQMASGCLDLHNTLLDYNTLNPQATRPFPVMFSGLNPEIILHLSLVGRSFFNSTLTGVDSSLYRSFHTDDLRKTCFFRDRGNEVMGFKGSYLGSATLFGGLATDEIYLIHAECNARMGNYGVAVSDLNTLLASRFKTGTFKPLVVNDGQVLETVLLERRKQLVARGLRWSDIRRLNRDVGFAVDLERNVDGKVIRPANDNRFVFPIPDTEINFSGILQNPR